MNWVKTHKFISHLFPRYIWKIPNSENKIYLTFDDGPIPNVTEWVLNILKSENIKATFFCIGDNIKKHPKIFERIKNEGHSIGNHTFNHLNGWQTSSSNYIENFKKCSEVLDSLSADRHDARTDNKQQTTNNRLFRPPYGKISPFQAKEILNKNYKIIMWDILSYDFDTKISPHKCLSNVIKNTESGSIIVFHDSLKAEQNLRYALPKAIKFLKEKGFEFDVIK